MYLAVCINSGGYIYVNALSRKMVHRETRGLHHEFPCSAGQGDLRWKCGSTPSGMRGTGIAQLTAEGGVEALWVPESQAGEWRELLKIWNGCYGSWPVHTWKEAA
jgi:hypothetical protein